MPGIDPAARATPSRRGQAREEAILDAVAELLTETGYERLTVDAIAARARTSKATMYRRWPGKAEIVADVLRRQAETVPEARDTGTLRGDLLAALDGIAHAITGQDGPSFLGLLEGIRDDDALRDLVRDQIERRSAADGPVICSRAAARGEQVATDQAAGLLGLAVAHVLTATLLQGTAPTPAERRRFADEVLLPLLTRRG